MNTKPTAPLFPAIVDATCDRLRPVLLTTLTTVLGLAPLLYETSAQAQFLRPTVITLCYGLGFGMFLVLLLVPSLLAIGHDVRRQMTALRRALRLPMAQRGRGFGLLSVSMVLALSGWAAATMGAMLYSGAIMAILASQLPQITTPGHTFGLFIAGTAVITLIGYIIGGLGVFIRRRSRTA